MRAMLGKDTRPDSLFLQTYCSKGKGPGKVAKFSIIDVAQEKKGVKVRVKLTFKKQELPHGVNGVHEVYVEKENEVLGIRMIVAPIGKPETVNEREKPGQ